MSEDTQKRIMDWMAQTAEKIQDFAVTEIPPFIHEYLTWKFWENVIPIGVYMVIMIIIWGLFLKFGVKFWKVCIEEDAKQKTVFAIIPAVLTLVMIVASFANFPYTELKNCVQIKIAPKVYLIERAADLYNSNNKKQ